MCPRGLHLCVLQLEVEKIFLKFGNHWCIEEFKIFYLRIILFRYSFHNITQYKSKIKNPKSVSPVIGIIRGVCKK